MKTISVNNKLTAFAQQKLVISQNGSERANIKKSLIHLEGILSNNLKHEIQLIKRFGSYTRNTILPRSCDSESDIDILIVFNTSDKILTPGTYRTGILNSISRAYPKSVVKKDFPTVKLELNHIMFDLVPCITQQNSNRLKYYIPHKNDEWLETYPNDVNDLLASKNQGYGNNIVRNVIRLCKHWNSTHGRPFDSYELEKWIVKRYLFKGDNLYEKFLSIMNDIAGHIPHVNQALKHIRKYQGDRRTHPDEIKQLQWLKKLLPELEY